MSVTYKVTPRIGLNHRTGPGTGYRKTGAAIPCGYTVTGDGRSSDGWIHVQWRGRWGWSYGAYLRKVGESKPSVAKMAAKNNAANAAAAKKAAEAAARAAAAKAAALKKKQQEEMRRAKAAGKLASFGTELVFEVNSRKIMPAKNWKRTQNGRWATHDILGQVPRSEFQGPDRTETTLTVVFNAEHGVRPRSMISTVEKMIRKGQVDYLVMGGQIYGWGHKFCITGASEAWDTVYNRGELVKATMDLTFEEYC